MLDRLHHLAARFPNSRPPPQWCSVAVQIWVVSPRGHHRSGAALQRGFGGIGWFCRAATPFPMAQDCARSCMPGFVYNPFAFRSDFVCDPCTFPWDGYLLFRTNVWSLRSPEEATPQEISVYSGRSVWLAARCYVENRDAIVSLIRSACTRGFAGSQHKRSRQLRLCCLLICVYCLVLSVQNYRIVVQTRMMPST